MTTIAYVVCIYQGGLPYTLANRPDIALCPGGVRSGSIKGWAIVQIGNKLSFLPPHLPAVKSPRSLLPHRQTLTTTALELS